LAERPQVDSGYCVVIPARNEADRISRCIGNVQRAIDHAGVGPWEILVVDDQSADDTVAVAQRSGATVIALSRHEGRLGAWLRGVEASTAPVIVFVDADCEVMVGAFASLLKAFGRSGVGVAAARAQPFGTHGDAGIVERSARFSALILHQIKIQLKNHDFLPIGRLMAIRREVWLVSDGAQAPCDRVVAHLATRAGWGVVYVPEAEVLYEPITTYGALREDYLRTRVVRVNLPLDRDPLPAKVWLQAALTGVTRSPADAAAWLACRALLLVDRVLRSGRPRPADVDL